MGESANKGDLAFTEFMRLDPLSCRDLVHKATDEIVKNPTDAGAYRIWYIATMIGAIADSTPGPKNGIPCSQFYAAQFLKNMGIVAADPKKTRVDQLREIVVEKLKAAVSS